MPDFKRRFPRFPDLSFSEYMELTGEAFRTLRVQRIASSYRRLLDRLALEDEAWRAGAPALLPEEQAALRLEVNATGQDFGPAAGRLLHTLMAAPGDHPACGCPAHA